MKKPQSEKNDKMEETPSTPMPPTQHERKPSIEAEPKTLLQEELNLAREAALKIVNTHSKEEALKIFLTGLVPVASSKQAKEEAAVSDCEEE